MSTIGQVTRRRRLRSALPSRGRTTLSAREQALLELVQRDTTDFDATCRAVTEAVTVLLDVARAGVWRFGEDRRTLVCDDLFLRDSVRHSSGQVIDAADAPTYFATVSQSLAIHAHDAARDWRTRELLPSYLAPLGIGAMLDVPIWQAGRACGVLCCEHVGLPRRWSIGEEHTAEKLADLVARGIEASERRFAEERWEIIVEAIPEIVVVIDDESRIIRANTAARRAIGEEGKSSFETRFTELEVRDLSRRVLPRSEWPGERARSGEIVRGDIVEFSSRLTSGRRWFRATCAPVWAGDRVRHVVAVYSDVGDEMRMERLKRDFLSALAHELRTPVTIVKGHARRLAKMPDLPPAAAEAHAAIGRGADRLGRLVDDLVDVSAITLGRIVLFREPENLEAVVALAVERSRASSTHQVAFARDAPHARVVIDRGRIERVVEQLLENAACFSPRGSQIDVTLRVDEDGATITVKDRGVGIPPEKQMHVFEPFFRAHTGTPFDAGGLGIGLFLAHEVVVRHGGTLSFESDRSGTTFWIRLPLEGARR